ncbi:MAG: transposase [Candidatus Omnitrophota bacterium]|jgi:putative transposase
MPRGPRCILPGLPHHALQRGNNRGVIFHNQADKEYFLDNLKKSSFENKVAIGAYCLMSNHFHLLLYPESKEGFIRFMKYISQIYSQHFNRIYKRTGKLWENRYKLNIVDPEFEWVISRYIEQNPVRAGMVRAAEEYQYSSARMNLEGGRDEIVTKDIVKGKRDKYKEFFSENTPESRKLLLRLREVTQQEKVFGGADFIRQLETQTKLFLGVRVRGRPRKEGK